MTKFKNWYQQKAYEMSRRHASDPTSDLYYNGHPHRGAGHRAAYWDGRSGMKTKYVRDSLAYACWAAGRDDLKEFGPVQFSRYGELQAARNAEWKAKHTKT